MKKESSKEINKDASVLIVSCNRCEDGMESINVALIIYPSSGLEEHLSNFPLLTTQNSQRSFS